MVADGKTLVSGSKDGSVFLWDTTIPQHKHALTTIPRQIEVWGFTPDSQAVLTLDTQGRMARWKGMDFDEMESWLEVGPNAYGSCLSHDGRLLAVGSLTGEVQVWDVQRRALQHQTKVCGGPVRAMHFFSQRNTLVLSYGNDNAAQPGDFHEWNLTNWEETGSWHGVPNTVQSAFSPDDRWSLTYNLAGSCLLRDLSSGREREFQLHGVAPDNTGFSPDGQFFGVGSSYGRGMVWETATLREVMPLHGFLMGLHSVAFSPDDRRVVGGSAGLEAIKLWDMQSHRDLLTLEGKGSIFARTTFSPDGNVLGSVNNQNVLHLWRAPSWEEINTAEAKDRAEGQKR